MKRIKGIRDLSPSSPRALIILRGIPVLFFINKKRLPGNKLQAAFFILSAFS
jgi:hypothetical protein